MHRLTIERTAVLTLFVLLLALATRVPLDTDTWWHLRSGEYTLQNGVMMADAFSSTRADAPWTNHSWLAQVVLVGVWRAGGYTGLALYTAVCATIGMAFVFAASPGNSYLRAFVVVLGAATAAVFWAARPHTLSFMLSAITIWLLRNYQYRQRDWLWVLPPMLVLWGNLHAGYTLGFIILGGFWAGNVLAALLNPRGEGVLGWAGVRRLTVIGLVSAAFLWVNPYTWRVYTIPFETVGLETLRAYIQEWQSPNFQGRETWPFIALLLALLGAVGASPKRITWPDFLLAAGTATMALLAGRNIALFAVVAPPILADHLNALLAERGWVLRPTPRATPRIARLNMVLLGVVLLGALAKIVYAVQPSIIAQAEADLLPVSAVAYLRAHPPQGTLFNSYNWGGYLLYVLPGVPVFIDGRTDLYGDEILGDYIQAATARVGWQAVLDRYDVQTVMVERASGLGVALADAPGWTVTYSDDLAIVVTRNA